MPIGNIIVLGLIVSAFVVFMVALAWGAWCSRQEPSPRRAARSARPSRSENDGELAPIRIGR